MESIANQVSLCGRKVFYYPEHTYSYDELIHKVLGSNTYRGFHRIDKTKPGASTVFEGVMRSKKEFIIRSLLNARSEKDIDKLSRDLCDFIKNDLQKCIIPLQLLSYNKIRKPVDIIVEHFVALCIELDSVRVNLISFLFLPLDSWMFRSDFVFSDSEIDNLGISRNFTFKDIEEEEDYYLIQNFLREKAKSIHIEHRIFFDLIWGDRYKKNLKNLFADSDLIF